MTLLPNGAPAQVPAAGGRFWFGFGAGAAHRPPIALTGQISRQTDAHLVSARGVVVGHICTECDEQEALWDLGLLYGRSTTARRVHASVALGPAFTGRGDTGLNPEKYVTIGLAGQVQLFANLAGAGVGILGFANANSRESYYGLSLNLLVGQFH